MKFRFLPHTADAKFRAYGRSIEEMFSNAATALFEIITKTKKIKPRLTHKIKVESRTIEALLFDFLDELLFLLDTEGFLLNECKNMKIRKTGDGSWVLECDAIGDHFKGYEVSGNVKAVTYNDMYIKRPEINCGDNQDLWECQVVVDL